MKLEVKYSSKFKKGLKLAAKRGLDISLLESIVEKLKNRVPLEEKYKDHQLKGNMSKYRECHIQPDWLLVYLIEEDVLVLTLINTGTHADLFGEQEAVEITIQQKIDMALAYSGNVTKKDIADKLGVTPSAFGQRLKTGKFTQEELEIIANVLDAEYVSYFKFKDGKEI